MADTKHSATAPVEGDGISYSGIVWFLVILVGTVVFCQVFVWGMFRVMESRVVASDAVRAPLAAEPAKPRLEGGRLLSGLEASAAPSTAAKPGLLVDEPAVLSEYRKVEDAALKTYGWINQGTGVVRLPIDRAKALVLERGLPTRPGAAAPATAPVESAIPAAPAAAPAAH
jgi:hypothetical protein